MRGTAAPGRRFKRLLRWGCRLIIVGALAWGFRSPRSASTPSYSRPAPAAVLASVEEDPVDVELTRFANEILDARADSAVVEPTDRENEERLVRKARFGDAPDRENALLALMDHSGDEAVDAMLEAADPSQPAEVADRALDALLSVTDRLEGARRDEARARARLLADRGETSPRATALLLLAELGTESADRGRLETLALHEDARVSLAARRALIEYLGAHGESNAARKVWETLPSLSEKEP